MIDSNDIQHSIFEMQSKKSQLGQKKSKLQSEISQYKEMLSVISQGHETHDEIIKKKREAVTQLNEIDVEISQLKSMIKRRHSLKEEVKSKEEPKNLMVEAELIVMRDYYLKFAGDKTRVASLRSMAADFAGDLTKLLKKVNK